MLVTREADYAVRCVVEVARAGHTSAARVARVQGISPTFLGKIVQSLARAGILATRRGVGGGITLAKDPRTFTLLDVIEAVEGRLSIIECLRSPDGCPHAGECPAYRYLELAQDRLREALDVPFVELLGGPAGLGLSEPIPAIDLAPVSVAPRAGTEDGHRARVRTRTPDPAARGDAR